MEYSSSVREQVTAEAVDWFLKFQSPGNTPAYHAAFGEWLLRSPLHVEEYLAVSSAWGVLRIPADGAFDTEALISAARAEHEPVNVVRLADRQTPHMRRRPEARTGRKRWASVAAVLVLGTSLWFTQHLWFGGTDYATAVGEQRSVTLSDGSVVYLNTSSQVRVRWSAAERHIDLLRGEARFQVAKNPARPFVVATSKATVRAVGTVFNVRADQGDTQVAVIEGRVEVRTLEPLRTQEGPHASAPTASAVLLAAGEHAEVTPLGINRDRGQSIEAATAWTDRRLVFRGESLATVVAEFNRYRSQPLVLDDPQLAHLQISGAFDLSDPESLLTYLKSYETVRVVYSRDGAEHLSREPASTESTH
jgi:transmembrane sensor